mmetsp:Transcript_30496/g.47774  ORF Transcript_30496/g.47774 Transcript_30496/m.47774 type:complete len:231 (+) Transcript_30496:91-783(+)
MPQKNWSLDKLGGIWAPNSSKGPHKKFSSIPLSLIIKNKLKYALNSREVSQILSLKTIRIDHKQRTDKNFSVGIMDVLTIDKTKENFRILYDRIGKLTLHRISDEESNFKISKVLHISTGKKGVPLIVTQDGRTIIYPETNVKTNDSVLLNLANGKIIDYLKFCPGSLCLIIGGSNKGKTGIIINEFKGGSNSIMVKDFYGYEFETKINNILVIGKGYKSFISLPKILHK